MTKITPIGKQREVMALPARGHIVVLGTAGSGKTTIALYRAIHLASLPSSGKVLLVTFNGALVEYMKGISDCDSPHLMVETYHKFARGYLSSRGKLGWNQIVDTNARKDFIAQALEALREQYSDEDILKQPVEFFIDEISFFQKFGFPDYRMYSKKRPSIDSIASNDVHGDYYDWVVLLYAKYKELREAAGKKYDWDDLACYAYNELILDSSERRYSHIIVDEGQDFSPMMIRSLVKAVADGGSFSFFGDVAQQIYGSRLSWRDSGIDTKRIWRFNANYRNPATIIKFAKDIINSPCWKEDKDMVEATIEIAEGPKPVLIKFSSEQNEMEWVVERAIALGETSSTAVVCRSRRDVRRFKRKISDLGGVATEIDKDTPGYPYIKTVYLTTFHAAKGLEFDNVFIPYLADSRFPDPDIVSREPSNRIAYGKEMRLLYVAVTRSKYGLYMTYSGILSALFPQQAENYDFYDEEELA